MQVTNVFEQNGSRAKVHNTNFDMCVGHYWEDPGSKVGPEQLFHVCVELQRYDGKAQWIRMTRDDAVYFMEELTKTLAMLDKMEANRGTKK